MNKMNFVNKLLTICRYTSLKEINNYKLFHVLKVCLYDLLY